MATKLNIFLTKTRRWFLQVNSNHAVGFSSICLLFFCASLASAQPIDLVEIETNTWYSKGALDDFNPRNEGNIANIGVIKTSEGVVIIDTGSSKKIGEALRDAVAKKTNSSVNMVFNTHFHPDHVFGNSVFGTERIFAHQNMISALKVNGEGFLENLFRMVGNPMKDSKLSLPKNTISEETTFTLGRNIIRAIPLSGHSSADLAIFDETTGVLFAGDLVFFDRAPATPHADLNKWLDALDYLESLPFKVLVPGHGPAMKNSQGIEQTRSWIVWIQDTFSDSAKKGLGINEVLRVKIPEEFSRMKLARSEYHRSVIHVYPTLEKQSLWQ